MTTRIALSAPYSTRAIEIAWRKKVRDEHQQCRKENPALMRRLAKLTDAQLDRVYAAVLELEPPSASRDYELRSLRELETLRSAPKPKRGGKVPRLRLLPPEQRPTLHEQPPGLAAITPPPTVQPTNTVEADKSGPPAARPEPAKPSNVVFCSKFFHNGRVSPKWIGGEV